MTVSVIVGLVIVVAIVLYFIQSRRKDRRRLDELHITGDRDS